MSWVGLRCVVGRVLDRGTLAKIKMCFKNMSRATLSEDVEGWPHPFVVNVK